MEAHKSGARSVFTRPISQRSASLLFRALHPSLPVPGPLNIHFRTNTPRLCFPQNSLLSFLPCTSSPPAWISHRNPGASLSLCHLAGPQGRECPPGGLQMQVTATTAGSHPWCATSVRLGRKKASVREVMPGSHVSCWEPCPKWIPQKGANKLFNVGQLFQEGQTSGIASSLKCHVLLVLPSLRPITAHLGPCGHDTYAKHQH